METSLMLLLLMFSFVLLSSAADLKETSSTVGESRLDQKLNDTSTTSSLNEKQEGSSSGDVKLESVDQEKKSKEGVKVESVLSNNNSSSESEDVKNSGGDSNKGSKSEDGIGDKKENSSVEEKTQDVRKESDSELLRKEGTRGVEECHSSNKCVDEEKKIVACLRVPGNDSPDLSLLILNKAKGPLTVTISAPSYVWIEKTKVQLPEKDGKTLKVSVKNRGPETSLVLKTGTGSCILDFRDLIAQNTIEESNHSLQPTYLNILSQKPIIAFASFAGLLILASTCICISIRRKSIANNASKYQRLDMELPVAATAVKTDNISSNDGWDNSWGDGWDDEEAPMTPTLPVTPSLSAKGLAPRRLNKEGWKD